MVPISGFCAISGKVNQRDAIFKRVVTQGLANLAQRFAAGGLVNDAVKCHVQIRHFFRQTRLQHFICFFNIQCQPFKFIFCYLFHSQSCRNLLDGHASREQVLDVEVGRFPRQ